MLEGSFVEASSNDHCRLRDRLLSVERALPEPEVSFSAGTAAFSGKVLEDLESGLAQHGLGVVRLSEPLGNDAFLELGSALGTAIPENAPAVRSYVEEGVVLNLRADAGITRDVSLQPFASNPLTLHSEGSGRSVADQPRYIVLMCVSPGDNSASTVLVPMTEVAAGMSDEDLCLLGVTRYADAPGVPPIVRAQGGRTVFSFRDFQQDALRWVCAADGATQDAVNRAIGRLLVGMYEARGASGVVWSRGLLVVIDNTRFFHGRTAGLPRAAARTRHLKRLRLR